MGGLGFADGDLEAAGGALLVELETEAGLTLAIYGTTCLGAAFRGVFLGGVKDDRGFGGFLLGGAFLGSANLVATFITMRVHLEDVTGGAKTRFLVYTPLLGTSVGLALDRLGLGDGRVLVQGDEGVGAIELWLRIGR